MKFVQAAASSDANDLNPGQVMNVLLGLGVNSDIVEDFVYKVMVCKSNPDGIPSFKLYQVKVFSLLLLKGHELWDPASRFHYLVDPALTKDQMTLLSQFSEHPEVFTYIKSCGPDRLQQLTQFIRMLARTGIPPASVSWMFTHLIPMQRMQSMLRVYMYNPTIPIQLFEKELNAKKFYLFYSMPNRDDIIQQIVGRTVDVSTLNIIDKTFALLEDLAAQLPDVNFSDILTSSTLNSPAIIKVIADRSCHLRREILTAYKYPLEVRVEWYNWVMDNLDNFETVYRELTLSIAESPYTTVTEVELIGLLRALRNATIQCRRQFSDLPAGIYSCRTPKEINAFVSHHLESLHSKYLDSTLKDGGIDCLYNTKNFGRSLEFPSLNVKIEFPSSDFGGFSEREFNQLMGIISRESGIAKILSRGKAYKLQISPLVNYSYRKLMSGEYEFRVPPELLDGNSAIISYRTTYSPEKDVIKVFV